MNGTGTNQKKETSNPPKLTRRNSHSYRGASCPREKAGEPRRRRLLDINSLIAPVTIKSQKVVLKGVKGSTISAGGRDAPLEVIRFMGEHVVHEKTKELLSYPHRRLPEVRIIKELTMPYVTGRGSFKEEATN